MIFPCNSRVVTSISPSTANGPRMVTVHSPCSLPVGMVSCTMVFIRQGIRSRLDQNGKPVLRGKRRGGGIRFLLYVVNVHKRCRVSWCTFAIDINVLPTNREAAKHSYTANECVACVVRRRWLQQGW